MRKHLILTASDAHYGDFLIGHWLRSLKATATLTYCDIVVLNYGLSERQLIALQNEQVRVIPGSRVGHVVSMRFIDAAQFLRTHAYDQVLFVDGGDIIFQQDIAPLFGQHVSTFRAVKLDNAPRFAEMLAYQHHLTPATLKKVQQVVRDKPVLNAGVIFGPATLFIELGAQINALIKNKKNFGPDQMIVNYVLYSKGVHLLDRKYNYLLGTARDGIVIKKGVFFTKSGEKIAIVHNAGHMSVFRPVKNFGFGPGHNQIKLLTYYLKNSFFKLLSVFDRS